MLDEKDMVLTLKDQELKKTIMAQLKINFIIKENAKLLEKIKSGNVVTIINDLGERYFSAGLWE